MSTIAQNLQYSMRTASALEAMIVDKIAKYIAIDMKFCNLVDN
jgi:hypothetical protein